MSCQHKEVIKAEILVNEEKKEFCNCQDCGVLVLERKSGEHTAKEEKFIFESKYGAAEMLTYLKIDEARYPPVHSAERRTESVKKMQELSKRFKQSDETYYHAVEFLDQFMTKNPEQTDQRYQLLEITCFYLAMKTIELDDLIPQLKEIIRHLQRYQTAQNPVPSREEVIECERELMEFFKWDLNILMPFHFIQSYLSNGVIFQKEPFAEEKVGRVTIRSQELCDSILKDYDLRKYKASLVAASIIYSAREYAGMQESWPESLQTMMPFTQEQVNAVAQQINAVSTKPSQQENKPSKDKENQPSSTKTRPVAPKIISPQKAPLKVNLISNQKEKSRKTSPHVTFQEQKETKEIKKQPIIDPLPANESAVPRHPLPTFQKGSTSDLSTKGQSQASSYSHQKPGDNKDTFIPLRTKAPQTMKKLVPTLHSLAERSAAAAYDQDIRQSYHRDQRYHSRDYEINTTRLNNYKSGYGQNYVSRDTYNRGPRFQGAAIGNANDTFGRRSKSHKKGDDDLRSHHFLGHRASNPPPQYKYTSYTSKNNANISGSGFTSYRGVTKEGSRY